MTVRDVCLYAWCALILSLAATVPSAVGAQGAPSQDEAVWTGASEDVLVKLNDISVGIVTGGLGSTSLRLATDMAAVLDGARVRIVPVVGRGGAQNLLDLLKLRGVDAAITQTDILAHFRKFSPGGTTQADRITYVAKLGAEELHVIARADVKDIKALAGKTVSFGQSGSSEDFSGRRIFDRLKIATKPVNINLADALDRLHAGTIDALVLIAGRPSLAINALRQPSGFKLLAVPYVQSLEDDYLPGVLTSADYPALIGGSERVETVAVGSVLVAFGWQKGADHYDRMARFVTALFDHVGELQKSSRHPKWADVNVAATLAGWRRFPAAQEWLDSAAKASVGASTAQR